ncbi:MAG: deoxyhypusine synthase family protein [Candidatus Micrarchaeota archaeon]|nr:deoxyhypusine synthase family protein [Candidatus Micrarchaeota archaeon]
MNKKSSSRSVKEFIEENYKHFNSLQLKLAAKELLAHLKANGKLIVTIAGAMSTAELGISLAKMIRKNRIHAISCTGANLEEDLYNLIGNKDYKNITNYKELSKNDEETLLKEGFNRITDTAIPEKIFNIVDNELLKLWKKAEERNERKFPHEYFYEIINSKCLENMYCIPKENSWLYEAAKRNLPLFVPGWEDSTSGNFFAAKCMKNEIKNANIIKCGLEYMMELIKWYKKNSEKSNIGFFQIGGGIAGDFAVCVVPLIKQDMKEDVKEFSYFCQISDSTTSYGSYSGAVPNEKITWGKLSKNSKTFMIESDATIVAPLIFEYVLAEEF